MALEISFSEDYKESRDFEITQESFEQNFVFYICGNMLEEADIDPTYGADDDLVAMEAAYSIIPPTRQVPLYDGSTQILTLNRMSVKMLSYNMWRVAVSYGTPNNGGQLGGGYNQAYENGDENDSDMFVQLSFNVSTTQETKKTSIAVRACQRNVDDPKPGIPYTVGRPGPIGLTENGIEGSPTYVRQFDFSITAYFTPQQLTFAYSRRLYRLATTLNADTFFGFPARSVIFLEGDASGDVFSVVPVNLSFKMRPNFKFSQTSATTLALPAQDDVNLMFDTYYQPEFPDSPAGSAPGDAFSGWSEVDYLYKSAPNEGMTIMKPYLRNIHQKYWYSDFNYLFPTTP